MTPESYASIKNSIIYERRKFKELPTIKEIKERTELAIRYHFGKEPINSGQNKLSDHQQWINKMLKDFGQKLSTDPKHTHKELNQLNLFGKCEIFSDELQRCLKLVGLNSTKVGSFYITHFSLRTYGNEGEVIIDPTIGQYITGHNHVYVGKRNDLKNLVIEQARQENLSLIDTSGIRPLRIPINSDPEDFFRKQWPSLIVSHKNNEFNYHEFNQE